ncbi:MAG: peptidoglycan DD-metalloendopeptidase family protein, partial [Lawsonibacter sp.]|nr:peptidoglycan DD-metalloendopeptidase family protein [Lawsonibacter sp.]
AGTILDYTTTAFIGDSLIVGLDSTQKLKDKGATVVAEVGAGLDRMAQLVNSSSLNSSIRSVYLLCGTNSCLDSDDSFQSKYQNVLSAIGVKAPGAKIIMISIFPMIENRPGYHWNASNAALSGKNEIVKELAASGGFSFLDVRPLLEQGGQLNAEYDSGDGLHLNAKGYSVWHNYILNGSAAATGSSEFTGSGINVDDIASNYTLYSISAFKTIDAVNMQARVSAADDTAKGWLATLVGGLNHVLSDALDFIGQFWSSISNLWADIGGVALNQNVDECFQIGSRYNSDDIRGVVYHTLTFSNQEWYSTVAADTEEKLEAGELAFLFVGDDAGMGNSSLDNSFMNMIPGTNTTVEGLISPTDTYYSPLSQYSGSSMEISTPEGTPILAVGKGKVIKVGTDPADAKGQYVTISVPINGDTYEITYGYLGNINVAEGADVAQKDIIGWSGTRSDGTPALYLSVFKNGINVNPSSIFYQPVVVGGTGLGGDLYNEDGSISAEKIAALEAQLKELANPGGSTGKTSYYQKPLNTLQHLQCTWWAFGRGWEYLQTIRHTNMTIEQYRKAIRGNGGDYAANNNAAGLFKSGSSPKPNSLACYVDPGHAGHVTYVEAVDFKNNCYYESECGSGTAWLGLNKRAFGYAPHWHGRQYRQAVFIYLDEPIDASLHPTLAAGTAGKNGAAILKEAEKYIGKPYVWGGSSPEESFDCSGFVCWVYNHSGWNIGRLTATEIYNRCTQISASEAQAGDLVFFTKTFTSDKPITHIGIYMGNSRMIHSGPSTNGVGYVNLNTNYWREHTYAYARLP